LECNNSKENVFVRYVMFQQVLDGNFKKISNE